MLSLMNLDGGCSLPYLLSLAMMCVVFTPEGVCTALHGIFVSLWTQTVDLHNSLMGWAPSCLC